jgi:predicted SAM-dependent methyltransferase
MTKLNIGSGNRNPQSGYLALDANLAMQPDLCARVPPIPLADESVEAIYCSHMLEHLDSDQASALIAEMWRVMLPGAVARIIVPYVFGQGAWQDPTHRSFWTPERFRYYTPAYRYLHYGLEDRFELVKLECVEYEVRAALRKVAA